MAAEASTLANYSCSWSEEASNTLIEAWGELFLKKNRGKLRHDSWNAIMKIVNSFHGRCPEMVKTDIHCKNCLDKIKQKFKSEKAQTDQSNSVFKSSWRFYNRMEFFIGNSLRYHSRNARVVSPPPVHYDKNGVPFFRNEGMENGVNRCPMANDSVMGVAEEEEEEIEVEDGLTSFAKVIEGFGEVYERVESMKVRHMVELEKERMLFAKELELHRMKMFVDMHMHLEEARAKRAGSNDGPSTKRSRTLNLSDSDFPDKGCKGNA